MDFNYYKPNQTSLSFFVDNLNKFDGNYRPILFGKEGETY